MGIHIIKLESRKQCMEYNLQFKFALTNKLNRMSSNKII